MAVIPLDAAAATAHLVASQVGQRVTFVLGRFPGGVYDVASGTVMHEGTVVNFVNTPAAAAADGHAAVAAVLLVRIQLSTVEGAHINFPRAAPERLVSWVVTTRELANPFAPAAAAAPMIDVVSITSWQAAVALPSAAMLFRTALLRYMQLGDDVDLDSLGDSGHNQYRVLHFRMLEGSFAAAIQLGAAFFVPALLAPLRLLMAKVEQSRLASVGGSWNPDVARAYREAHDGEAGKTTREAGPMTVAAAAARKAMGKQGHARPPSRGRGKGPGPT